MDERLPCCWCTYLREQARLPLRLEKQWGRCDRCYAYRWKYDVDRPLDVIEREIEKEQLRAMLVASA